MKKVICLATIFIITVVSLNLVYVFEKNTDNCYKEVIETNYTDGKVTLYCIENYSKKEFDDLFKDNNYKEKIIYKDKTKIYKYKKYSYLFCNNKNIVISDNSLKYTEALCK